MKLKDDKIVENNSAYEFKLKRMEEDYKNKTTTLTQDHDKKNEGKR